jgi:hypothetical protein
VIIYDNTLPSHCTLTCSYPVARNHDLVSKIYTQRVAVYLYVSIPKFLYASFYLYMQSLGISTFIYLPLFNPVNMLSMWINFILLCNSQLNIFLSLLRCDRPKQNIHLFQTASSRILEKNEDEHSHSGAEASEHDKGAPADAIDGCGCDFCDDEIEEPLFCCISICLESRREERRKKEGKRRKIEDHTPG